MKRRVVELAEQLLKTVPADEIRDLIRLLTYYNSTFAEADRALAMRVGSSQRPLNAELEQDVVATFSTKTAGSQNLYMVGTNTVCRCCGK